jgi:hypothetical protein
MLDTRLPIGIRTFEGLAAAMNHDPAQQRAWIAEHEPVGFDLVLAGRVFARDGIDDDLVLSARNRLQQLLLKNRLDHALAWRWLALGYWLQAEQVALEAATTETDKVWRGLFLDGPIHEMFETLGWRVRSLDENREVEFRLGTQRLPFVVRQSPGLDGTCALHPGDEVLVSPALLWGDCICERNRRIYQRFLTPARPATEELVALSPDVFHPRVAV